MTYPEFSEAGVCSDCGALVGEKYKVKHVLFHRAVNDVVSWKDRVTEVDLDALD